LNIQKQEVRFRVSNTGNCVRTIACLADNDNARLLGKETQQLSPGGSLIVGHEYS
jgi:hypothetical protein